MTKILIVDDKPERYQGLLAKLNNTVDLKSDIEVRVSIKDGLDVMKNIQFDILILDMFIPEVSWSTPIPDGGLKLLEYLDEDPGLTKPKHIVGITAALENLDSLESEFQSRSWALLKTSGGLDWEASLLVLIEHVIEVESSQNQLNYQSDICILTALRHPEFEALVASNRISLNAPELIDNSTYIQRGIIKSNGVELSVIVGCCLRMGSTEAALLTSLLISRFRPKILVHCGICAGYEGDVQYGDVIVAEPCWDYSLSSKVTTSDDGHRTIEVAPDFINVDSDLLIHLKQYAESSKEFLLSLIDSWPGDKPRGEPKIIVGPSATGPAVIADAKVFSDLRKNQHRKTVGLEMEAYGVYYAVKRANRPRPLCFSAKAVCDYASFLKDDKYQKYAAYTSAEVVLNFIQTYGSIICKSL